LCDQSEDRGQLRRIKLSAKNWEKAFWHRHIKVCSAGRSAQTWIVKKKKHLEEPPKGRKGSIIAEVATLKKTFVSQKRMQVD